MPADSRLRAQSGGSLLASFETSLYDENLNRRADFGLADVLGISKAGDAIGIKRQFVLRTHRTRASRFSPDSRTPTGCPARRIVCRSKPVQNPLLTVVPGFVNYPPELAYPSESHTDEPAIVLREVGKSRIAYFPGDIERTFWLTGHGDLLRLLHNTLRWITYDEAIVQVDGDGFIEMFAWETSPGYAIHLLNYTNPNAQHGWVRSVYPLGPQHVRMKLARRSERSIGRTTPRRNHSALRYSGRRPALHRAARGGLRGRGNHGVRVARAAR